MVADVDREFSQLPGTKNFSVEEFQDDLNAVWYEFQNEQQVLNWLGYPAMLKRLASLMAEQIDAQVDRIVATGLAADTLGTAIALETGIPFAVLRLVDESLLLTAGNTHPEENIALFSFWPSEGTDVQEWAKQSGLSVSSWTVFAQQDEGSALLAPQQALFASVNGKLVYQQGEKP